MKPFKHKLGELDERHFDGDPIDPGVVSEGRRMQAEAVRAEVMKGFPPKNAIQKPVQGQGQPKPKK